MMRAFQYICTTALLSAVFVLPAGGQQPARPQGPPAAAAAVDGGVTRVAVIRTDAFYDPAQGINRLVIAAKGMEQEFQPRMTELQNMQKRAEQLAGEAESLGLDPKARQDKTDQLEQLRRELQYKEDEVQADFNKRSEVVLNPIFDDLSKALDSFARERGIMMILDARKLEGAILYVSEGLDMTQDFIADYNRRNPAAPARPRQ